MDAEFAALGDEKPGTIAGLLRASYADLIAGSARCDDYLGIEIQA